MRRSSDRYDAVEHLLGTMDLADKLQGVALIDDKGRVLAGAGAPRMMWTAARTVQRRVPIDGDLVPSDPLPGLAIRRIASTEGPLTLAAIGVAQGPVGRAAEGVARIFGSR